MGPNTMITYSSVYICSGIPCAKAPLPTLKQKKGLNRGGPRPGVCGCGDTNQGLVSHQAGLSFGGLHHPASPTAPFLLFLCPHAPFSLCEERERTTEREGARERERERERKKGRKQREGERGRGKDRERERGSERKRVRKKKGREREGGHRQR